MIGLIAGLVVGGIIGVNIILRVLVGRYKGFTRDLGKEPIVLLVWGEFDASEWSLGPNIEYTNGGYGYHEVGGRINLVCVHAGVSLSWSPTADEMRARMLAGSEEEDKSCA